MIKIIYDYHSLSIRKKLMFSYTVLVILPIFVFLVLSTKMISNIVLEKANQANTNMIESASKRVDRLLYDVTYTLLNISKSNALSEVIHSDTEMLESDNYKSSNPQFLKNQNYIQNIFENAPISMIILSARITILCANGISYGNWQEYWDSTSEFRKSSWYMGMAENISGNVMWLGINENISSLSSEKTYMLETAIPIKNNRASSNYVGIVYLAIPERDVYETLEPENISGEILLVDSNRVIISSADKTLIGMKLDKYISVDDGKFNSNSWYVTKNNKNTEVVVNMNSIEKTSWKIITIVPYNKMMSQLFYVRNVLMFAGFLFAIAFLVFALLISNSISKPIILLNRKILMVESGKLNERVEVKYHDEIGNLSRNFNNMLDKINMLLKAIKFEEKMKREAELDFLQAQINPHFIFNTLSSIRWATVANNDTKAEEMVLALSNLLKASMSKGPEKITLQEEIAILKYYIDICKMNQGYSYELNYDLDEETLMMKVPRLILQPIVENSIIHGFAEMKKGGIIRITAIRNANMLEIEIADNGKGFDDKRLEDILSAKAQHGKKEMKYSSIGIKNVDERIKLNFGEEYGLRIRNGKSGGTVVTLLLPAQGVI